MSYAGSYVALITPFTKGQVDEKQLRSLVDFQIENGTNGIVPCGTTGEAATMSEDEQFRVIGIVIDQVRGRVPVIAGTGTNDTAKTSKYTKHAKELGANAALIVTPYYNKPTAEGQYQHYRAITEATDLPIVLYNVPGRTAINMAPETVVRLSMIRTIVAIKEASGSIDQSSQIVNETAADFDVLSGDDSLTLPIMSVGGKGVISVVANVAPKPMAEMTAAFLSGDAARARDIHLRVFDLCRAMFLDNNPIAVKTAAGLLGLCSDEVRLPLTAMGEGNRKKLAEVLAACSYTHPVGAR
ncbi:MAG: 4-hydroxy-tetrahydrodipicolinate synthase [Chloroflexota bacterium]|nr:MAG: 4-hydroxy-tetrahydrodipicolinate synthase [Chloroflexota bacterium]